MMVTRQVSSRMASAICCAETRPSACTSRSVTLKALLFQPLQGMQDGVMLKRGGNDVLFALARAEIGGGGNGLIVGLAAAGGKIDLARLRAEAGGHIGPRRLEHLLGLLADGVEARRVAEGVVQGDRSSCRWPSGAFWWSLRCPHRLASISAPLQGILSYVLSITHITHKVNRFIGCTNSEKN